MSYIKFKELTKYFDLKAEVETDKLPEYTTEYVMNLKRYYKLIKIVRIMRYLLIKN